MEYTVYMIRENKVVKYVGQTKNFAKRKKIHLARKSNSSIPLESDLSNIEIEVFGVYETENEAVVVEDRLIQEYDTINQGWNKQRSGRVKAGNLREYNKEYYSTEKWKEYHKQYHRTEKWKEYIKEYEQSHKEHIKKRMHEYYLKNKERLIEKRKEFYQNKKLAICEDFSIRVVQ